MRVFKFAAIAGACFAATGAQAATIDFNEFANNGQYIFVNPFSSGGFNFTNSGGDSGALGVWGTQLASYSIDPNGAAIFHNYGGSITTVSRVGGGTFDLNSIDLGDVYNNGFGGTALFTFTNSMGTTAQTVTLDNQIGGQTFVFNQAGLTSFTMQGVTTQGGWLQFDNMVYDGVLGGVPEPSAWALLIVGFGLVGAGLRRQRAERVAVSYA